LKHFAPFFGIHINDAHDGAGEAKKESAEPASSGSKEGELHDPRVTQETAKHVEESKATDSVTTTPVNEPAVASPSPVPTIEESVVAESQDASASLAAGFTFVENEREDDKAEEMGAPEPAPEVKHEVKDDNNDDQPKPKTDNIDDKLNLLKEMGFEIPKDVAQNMIRELNGRMDLIVRALVANQK